MAEWLGDDDGGVGARTASPRWHRAGRPGHPGLVRAAATRLALHARRSRRQPGDQKGRRAHRRLRWRAAPELRRLQRDERARVGRRRDFRDAIARNSPAIIAEGTFVFVAGYLGIWILFSVAATAAQTGLDQAALLSSAMLSASPKLGAGLLIDADDEHRRPVGRGAGAVERQPPAVRRPARPSDFGAASQKADAARLRLSGGRPQPDVSGCGRHGFAIRAGLCHRDVRDVRRPKFQADHR